MKKLTAILLLLCLCAVVLTGCGERRSEAVADLTETAAENDPAGSAETVDGKSAENDARELTTLPQNGPDAAKAKELAALHGVSEEDLHGAYSLFVRFSEVLEAYDKLGDYREFVYRIFPLIADNTAYLDEDFFFSSLAELSIEVEEIGDGENGVYWFDSKQLYLNETMFREKPYIVLHSLFHELMHFVDYSINGLVEPVYLLDGKRYHFDETGALSSGDSSRLILCEGSEIVTEGGAELFASKYYDCAPNAYFPSVTFMTGLEYVMGEDFINELFLNRDSGALLEQLFFDIGYSPEDYQRVAQMLNSLSRTDLYPMPDDPISPEDMLIDLYEYKLGDGWCEDAGFHYILKCLNGIALDGWKTSEHSDFLETIEFETFSQYEDFQKKLFEKAKEVRDIDVLPPTPFMRNGKLLIGGFATLEDPQTGEESHGTVTFDYDFETDTLRNYYFDQIGGTD